MIYLYFKKLKKYNYENSYKPLSIKYIIKMKKILILLSFIPTLLLAQTTVSMYDFYQGGVVFHLDANGGGLIASPGDQINPTQNFAQHGYGIYYFDWGCKGTSIATGDSLGAGAQNTINIEALCTTANTAADVCAN